MGRIGEVTGHVLFRSRVSRTFIGALALLGLCLVSLGHPLRSAASSPVQRSSQVAVIPGFAPAHYPGTKGVPALPLSASLLKPYHFSQLAVDQITASALSPFDTVVLYGIRWKDIPKSGQAAINAFAATRKVVIWDADDTGPQAFSNFIHPFSTQASGEHGQHGASVVSYPAIKNYLASDKANNPFYLDPNVMVNDQHMIAHMNAMNDPTTDWVPALQAANKVIPNGGWVVAWSYGNIANGTGLVVYSGIDADTFVATVDPNYAIKELALGLAAPFRQTAAPCATGCTLPTHGGKSYAKIYAACTLAKQVPTHRVHGRVPIVLRTSIAAGITARVLTHKGRVVARGREKAGDLVRLSVDTRKLRSNRTSRLLAVVYVKGQRACTTGFRLKVGRNTRMP